MLALVAYVLIAISLLLIVGALVSYALYDRYDEPSDSWYHPDGR